MKMNRIGLVDGKPVMSAAADVVAAIPENDGFRVLAYTGESDKAACSKFVKAASADAAIQNAGNPFGDLSTGGWRKE